MAGNFIDTLSSDNQILVDTAWLARQPTFMLDTSWVRMRIGMRLTVEDSGANLTVANFQLGVCSGNTAIMGDASGPTHSFNFIHINTSNSWVRATSPTRYQATFMVAQTYVGTTRTSFGSDAEASTWNIFCADTSRTCLFMDIRKSGTSWTTRVFRNNSGTATDVSQATFESEVVKDNPVITNHSFTGNTTSTVDEATNGYMDHVCFYWPKSTRIRISSFAAVRLE